MRHGLNREIYPALDLKSNLKDLIYESEEVANELRSVLSDTKRVQMRPNSRITTPQKLTKPPVHDRVLRQYGVNIAELARFQSWQEPSAPEPVKVVKDFRRS